MTDRNVLSEEEIDALLTGVDSGDVDVDEEGTPTDDDVKSYDLTSQDRVVRGRLPTLELISEKFAREFRSGLQHMLRYGIEVGAGGVQVLKFSDYVQSLFVPTSLQLVKIHPFAGAGLVVLDAKLIFRLVDRLFGGTGEQVDVDGRDFTATEKRIIARIHELLAGNYQSAWADVLPIQIDFAGSEINPSLLNQFSADDVMMISTFRLELTSGGGELHIAIPYASLEPFKNVLDSRARIDGDELDSDWSERLGRRLLDAQVELSCEVAAKQLQLRELLTMQAGDVIEIDMPEVHRVDAGPTPLFMGKLGESRGSMALEFVDSANE